MKRLILLTFAAAVLTAVPLAAQDASTGVIAEGLASPRHIHFFGDTLYVADAGSGGDEAVDGVFGPAQRGETSSILAIADGAVTVLVEGLPSINEGGEITGASGVLATADAVWFTGRDGLAASYVRAVSLEDGSTVQEIDVLAAETELNPDGGIVDSNPVDLALDVISGVLYIADAGANTVWKWTEADGLSVFVTWPEAENPVPTSVEVDVSSRVWIGNLTGFPFSEGGAVVHVYDADGALVETYEGFTTIVDLLAANDTVYAVEFARFGEQGWTPNTGRLVDVTSGQVYADGLNLPYGVANDIDNGLMIALNSAYVPGNAGVILTLDAAIEMSGMMADAPAETPEASG
jgi:hypothetical protein